MSVCCINGRFLNQSISGVQRYGNDALTQLDDQVTILKPANGGPIQQHFWEQYHLPKRLIKHGNPLLLNFCNSAPLRYSNQVVTIHDVAVFENPSWFRPAFSIYYQLLFKKLTSRSKHIVTVSKFSKQEIQRLLGVDADRISVIYPSVSSHIAEAAAEPPASKPLEPYVLMVGNLDPRKNFSWALENCMAQLRKQGLQLVLVCNPSSVHRSPNINSDEINWYTHVSDSVLKWLYQHAEYLIHPAIYEGFSLVPFEAIQCGCKVVVSDIAVHREVLGDNATYFKLGDSKSFLDAMAQVVQRSGQVDRHRFQGLHSNTSWMDLIERFHEG